VYAADLLVNAMNESASNKFLIDGFPRKLDQLQDFTLQVLQCLQRFAVAV
jgi:hypothetical protein